MQADYRVWDGDSWETESATWTFAADEANPLRMKTETIAGTGLYNKVITRVFEGSGSGLVAGRDLGFQVGVTGDLDQDYAVAYHYDTAGRLSRIAGPGLDENDERGTRNGERAGRVNGSVASAAGSPGSVGSAEIRKRWANLRLRRRSAYPTRSSDPFCAPEGGIA